MVRTVRLGVCVVFAAAIGAVQALPQRESDPGLPGTSTEVTGQLRVPDRSIPVSNILIRLESSGNLIDQTTTDSNGRFRFSRLKRGAYTVVVKADGFAVSQQSVDLVAVSKVHILVDLVSEKKDALALGEETVDARLPIEALKKYQKGQSEWKAKKLERAIEQLKEATAIYPDFFDAHLLLGLIYRETQKWTEAATSLQRALSLRPKSPFALVELGEVYRRQKQYAAAEKCLREALSLDPKSWQANYTLARVFWETGDPAKAEPFISSAVQIKVDYAEAHLLWGNISVRLGQFESALREYETYLRLAPKGEFAAQTREIVDKLKSGLNARKPLSSQ